VAVALGVDGTTVVEGVMVTVAVSVGVMTGGTSAGYTHLAKLTTASNAMNPPISQKRKGNGALCVTGLVGSKGSESAEIRALANSVAVP
jgi:hypothetical protein